MPNLPRPQNQSICLKSEKTITIADHHFSLVSDDHHRQILSDCYELAANRSNDRSTQLGTIIVNEETGQEYYGYNSIDERHIHDEQRFDRPLKYHYTEHAERLAVFDMLASLNKYDPTRGLVMYVPWYACSDCARTIVHSGRIGAVVGHADAFQKAPDRWNESTYHGIQILKEAGINCCLYTGKVRNDGLRILFNGQLWNP
jgi:dCMP deaminase